MNICIVKCFLKLNMPSIQYRSLGHFWYQGSSEDFKDLCKNRPALRLKTPREAKHPHILNHAIGGR